MRPRIDFARPTPCCQPPGGIHGQLETRWPLAAFHFGRRAKKRSDKGPTDSIAADRWPRPCIGAKTAPLAHRLRTRDRTAETRARANRTARTSCSLDGFYSRTQPCSELDEAE